MTWPNKFFKTALVALATFQLLALSLYWRDRNYLARLADDISSPEMYPSEQAQRISTFLRDKPSETNPHYFLSPLLGFLRATPRQVAIYGGDCADRSRLLVVLLDVHGIRASKWALYSSDERPRHAVVELDAESGKMVIDGLFGLTFPRPGGGYYGIEDLRRHPEILPSRIAALTSRGKRPGADRLEGYPLDLYVYTHARTINWDKTASMRFLYRALHQVMGAKVNALYRPILAEQPALMVAWGLAGLEVVIAVCWIILARSGRRGRAARPGNSGPMEKLRLLSIPLVELRGWYRRKNTLLPGHLDGIHRR